MRIHSLLTAVLVVAACDTTPVARTTSPDAEADSAVQFLIASAATDFHTHNQSDPGRFRDVRVGHVANTSGERQYRLCGEFLQAQEQGEPKWMPFVTIKTSDYEQWIGDQTKSYCPRSEITWYDAGDLAAALQSRLDALR